VPLRLLGSRSLLWGQITGQSFPPPEISSPLVKDPVVSRMHVIYHRMHSMRVGVVLVLHRVPLIILIFSF
jgi:hypothetical protein